MPKLINEPSMDCNLSIHDFLTASKDVLKRHSFPAHPLKPLLCDFEFSLSESGKRKGRVPIYNLLGGFGVKHYLRVYQGKCSC